MHQRSPQALERMDTRYATAIYQLERNKHNTCVFITKTKAKSRNHLNALERRLELWERDEIKSLLLQAVTIQKKLTSNNDPKKIADILKKFAKLMGKTNINGLLNLVKNGVLPLGKKTLNSLKQIINGNYF